MKPIHRILNIIRLHCIVLADYAERYYAPLELSPEWGAISQQALADVFVKNHLEVY
jgi:hypothetical protein